jgi:hypothetical protein
VDAGRHARLERWRGAWAVERAFDSLAGVVDRFEELVG